MSRKINVLHLTSLNSFLPFDFEVNREVACRLLAHAPLPVSKVIIGNRFNFPEMLVIIADWTGPLPFLVSFLLGLCVAAFTIIGHHHPPPPPFFKKSLSPYAVTHEKMTSPLHCWKFQRCFNKGIDYLL